MTIPLATVQSAFRTRRAINSMFETIVGDGCRLHNAPVIPKEAFCISKMRNEESKNHLMFAFSLSIPSCAIYSDVSEAGG